MLLASHILLNEMPIQVFLWHFISCAMHWNVYCVHRSWDDFP